MSDTNPPDWTGTILTIAGTIVATLFASLAAVMRWLGVKYEADLLDLRNELKATRLESLSVRKELTEYRIFADNRAQEIFIKHEKCLEDHRDTVVRLRELEKA